MSCFPPLPPRPRLLMLIWTAVICVTVTPFDFGLKGSSRIVPCHVFKELSLMHISSAQFHLCCPCLPAQLYRQCCSGGKCLNMFNRLLHWGTVLKYLYLIKCFTFTRSVFGPSLLAHSSRIQLNSEQSRQEVTHQNNSIASSNFQNKTLCWYQHKNLKKETDPSTV